MTGANGEFPSPLSLGPRSRYSVWLLSDNYTPRAYLHALCILLVAAGESRVSPWAPTPSACNKLECHGLVRRRLFLFAFLVWVMPARKQAAVVREPSLVCEDIAPRERSRRRFWGGKSTEQ